MNRISPCYQPACVEATEIIGQFGVLGGASAVTVDDAHRAQNPNETPSQFVKEDYSGRGGISPPQFVPRRRASFSQGSWYHKIPS